MYYKIYTNHECSELNNDILLDCINIYKIYLTYNNVS